MEFVNLDDYGISFAQLVSAPAPVGRIMYYLVRAEEGELRHKAGSRDLLLRDNIGSAWAIEYMFGLGLLEKTEELANGVSNLTPTDKGREIYYALVPIETDFDDDEYNKHPENLTDYLMENRPLALSAFESAFREAPVFLLLKNFLAENGYEYAKKDFIDDFYEALLNHYEGTEYRRTSRTTTGANRVPSLIQTCQLVGYCFEEKSQGGGTRLYFNCNAVEEGLRQSTRAYSRADLKKQAEKEQQYIECAREALIERFGEMGTVEVLGTVRNPVLQDMFRNNLAIEFEGKCALCGLDCPQVLIASHIQEAALSTADEKADQNNGLLLCANHDKLFDRHLITFNFESGDLVVSDEIDAELREKMGLRGSFRLDDRHMTEARRSYLLSHNMKFYER